MNNQEMKAILETIGLKQEEGLLKWLFIPFWKALTATIIFAALCFSFSGSPLIAIMLIPIIAFGLYMSRKCCNRLREIRELL